MTLIYWTWVVVTLAGVAWLWVNVSHGAGVVALVWVVVSYLVLISFAWWDVRTDGYVMVKQPRPGSRLKRWRIGARRANGLTQWLEPGDKTA